MALLMGKFHLYDVLIFSDVGLGFLQSNLQVSCPQAGTHICGDKPRPLAQPVMLRFVVYNYLSSLLPSPRLAERACSRVDACRCESKTGNCRTPLSSWSGYASACAIRLGVVAIRRRRKCCNGPVVWNSLGIQWLHKWLKLVLAAPPAPEPAAAAVGWRRLNASRDART